MKPVNTHRMRKAAWLLSFAFVAACSNLPSSLETKTTSKSALIPYNPDQVNDGGGDGGDGGGGGSGGGGSGGGGSGGGSGGSGNWDFDIVYIRVPRNPAVKPKITEVNNPVDIEPGSELVLLHPDGSEEVLVFSNGNSAVVDPFVSFDGTKVYYSYLADAKDVQTQRDNAAKSGADIWVYDLNTRQATQLTHGEWTPNTAAGNWATDPMACQKDPNQKNKNCLGFGVFNLGACPISGGKIMFSSSRNSLLPNKSYTAPNLQLFVMDENGDNVELVSPMTLGSALHCTQLTDGRVLFSSYESQGLRDHRIWGLWYIYPDGRAFGPLLSAFVDVTAAHFAAQKTNGDLVTVLYYNANNYGAGSMVAFPTAVPPGELAFGSPSSGNNPAIQNGWSDHLGGKPQYAQFSFSPYGIYSETPSFTFSDDPADDDGRGGRLGKATHPSTAPLPAGGLLVTYSSGSVNKRRAGPEIPDFGLYWVTEDKTVIDPQTDFILIKNDPAYHETQPRPVVPFSQLNQLGLSQPVQLPFLPNDGSDSPHLPRGTAYGLVGTSSFYNHDVQPGYGAAPYGLDQFNQKDNNNGGTVESKNQIAQGGLLTPLVDAFGTRYEDKIYAVRLLAMETNTFRSYGPDGGQYSSSVHMRNKTGNEGNNKEGHERLRILGEIPLRKFDSRGQPILDYTGNPDTSFLAKIPADVPFTFQAIDANGMSLSISQTWHQVRPGEMRVDCGGCHAHNHQPVDFSRTEAAKSSYPVWDLTQNIPLLSKDSSGKPIVVNHQKNQVNLGDFYNVEYYEDIKPILQASCIQCHSNRLGRMEANLDLDNAGSNDFEGTWRTVCSNRDPNGASGEGYLSVTTNGEYNIRNNSRFIRHTSALRSLLMWKIAGARLDGMTNADFPTETIPGDPSTFPPGANRYDADLDYSGRQCPPPPGHPDYDPNIPQLSADQILTFARWIETGCSIDRRANHDTTPSGRHQYGLYFDDLRPTLSVQSPTAGLQPAPVTEIRFGSFDYYAGLDRNSLSAVADFAIGSIPAGTQLMPNFVEVADHVWSFTPSQSIRGISRGTLTFRVKDLQGNWAEIKRTFSAP